MRTLLVVTSLLVAFACGFEPLTVSLAEVSNGVARFKVVNRSEQDVRSINFELSFRSEDGGVVSVDTVVYETTTDASTGEPTAFVGAGDETFFPRSMPSNGVSATGKVLGVTFFDGTSWPEEVQ